jgi:hypothetical protein
MTAAALTKFCIAAPVELEIGGLISVELLPLPLPLPLPLLLVGVLAEEEPLPVEPATPLGTLLVPLLPVVPLPGTEEGPETLWKFAQVRRVLLAAWMTTERLPKKLPRPSSVAE